jgi:c-di-AMP phosphodiesterase-like protein
MNKRLRRLLEPGFGIFFAILLFFAALTFAYAYRHTGSYALPAVMTGIIVLLYFFYKRSNAMRRRAILGYIETLSHRVDSAANDSLVNFPLPLLIAAVDTDEIIWSNHKFQAISGLRDNLFEVRVRDIVPSFDLKWLIEGKSECPYEVAMQGRTYQVFGSLVRSRDRQTNSHAAHHLLAMLYWLDDTEFQTVKRELKLSRPVFAIIALDNYEEVVKNLTETAKSTLMASIDERITKWVAAGDIFLRRYDRDRYMLFFDQRALSALIADKFSVLDAVRELTSPSGVPVTLSIGIGQAGEHHKDSFQYASLAIDMALARGGDQVVIKDNIQFSFFGGRSKELEKRTKVKSRVMANTLGELIGDSDFVLVMGHRNSDIDSLGAAAGIACIARKRGKKTKIVTREDNSAAAALIERLKAQPQYSDAFIDPQEAMLCATPGTLLVIVDVSRTDFVESPELLQSVNRVAVIDHHRRAANYIDNAALSFHEPYASSTSELVTELMQYLVDSGDLIRVEAEALLGGIALDTKNFTMHTGVRTFEAAAFLRGAGADPIIIKKLFQTNLDDSMLRYDIVRAAILPRPKIAVAALDQPVPQEIAAQAADELLDIRDISASFVLAPVTASQNHDDETVYISARSLDQINVQVICEKLGGGGHMTIAGAQLTGIGVNEAVVRLMAAIDQYFEEAGEPS